MLGLGRDAANAHALDEKSFFSSFCSQKEVLPLLQAVNSF
jgi:hypothetical protein